MVGILLTITVIGFFAWRIDRLLSITNLSRKR